jgi:hypothetical protein
MGCPEGIREVAASWLLPAIGTVFYQPPLDHRAILGEVYQLEDAEDMGMTENIKTVVNTFRSTEEERWQWDLVAQKAGVRLSEFLRQAANEKAERVQAEKNG